MYFFSHEFNKHKRHYSFAEKETLAFILALKHFNVYISSVPVVAFTCHNPLILLNSLCPKKRLVRQGQFFLQSYGIDIPHIKGQDNLVADVLSCSSCKQSHLYVLSSLSSGPWPPFCLLEDLVVTIYNV